MIELNFYLAHYYDMNDKKFVPFSYTNIAENVFLNVETEETVADALKQLQNGRVYTQSELYTHIGNTSAHVTAGQMDNVFITLGELVQHVENTDIHVTINDKISWNGIRTIATQAYNLAEQVNERVGLLGDRIASLEDSLFSSITTNPFSLTFDNLAGLNVVKGVWNKERQRLEC